MCGLGAEEADDNSQGATVIQVITIDYLSVQYSTSTHTQHAYTKYIVNLDQT